MLKISFTNAEVSDHGYGLEVNGKSLEDIISTAFRNHNLSLLLYPFLHLVYHPFYPLCSPLDFH